MVGLVLVRLVAFLSEDMSAALCREDGKRAVPLEHLAARCVVGDMPDGLQQVEVGRVWNGEVLGRCSCETSSTSALGPISSDRVTTSGAPIPRCGSHGYLSSASTRYRCACRHN